MKKLATLFIAFLFACAPISPRVSLEESRIQRRQEFETEAKKDSVVMAAWNLKQNLKKDYREIIGPSPAFDEKMDLQFSLAINEAMLATPGQYEQFAKSWAANQTEPVPSRADLENMIKVLDGRIKKLDDVIAKEMQLAEERAKEDAERRAKIIQTIAAVALVTLAVAGAAAAGAAAYRSTGPPITGITTIYNSTAMGPYIITRTGPNTTTVLTPSHRVYTCTTTGTRQVTVVNCF